MRQILIFMLVSQLTLVSQATDVHKARATLFDGTTSACGLSQAQYDIPYVVALNEGQEYQGGINCGRYMRVTLGQACLGGSYDLSLGCQGKLQDDSITGKQVVLLVVEAGPEDGGWQSNKDTYHLDISQNAMTQLGVNWDNRGVTWQYILNPNYASMKIFFGYAGNLYWPCLKFTNLLNGIHGADRLVDGVWKAGKANLVNGLTYSFAYPAGKADLPNLKIRVYDADGNLYPGTIIITYPQDKCGVKCTYDVPLVYTTGPSDSSNLQMKATPIKSSSSSSSSSTSVASTSTLAKPLNSPPGTYTQFSLDYTIANNYGGNCGVPKNMIGAKYIVGLKNTLNPGEDVNGTYNSGKNCGRWVKITLGNKALYDVKDKYTGITINAIVADSLTNSFANSAIIIDNQAFIDLGFTNYDNRQVTWQFINAPSYTGDINISFGKAGQIYWPQITLTNLKSGISQVDRYVTNGTSFNWQSSTMQGNGGLHYVLPIDAHNLNYVIRVYDTNGVKYPSTYSFVFPSTCGSVCSAPTPVSYTKS